jgi:hypothetical protein
MDRGREVVLFCISVSYAGALYYTWAVREAGCNQNAAHYNDTASNEPLLPMNPSCASYSTDTTLSKYFMLAFCSSDTLLAQRSITLSLGPAHTALIATDVD